MTPREHLELHPPEEEPHLSVADQVRLLRGEWRDVEAFRRPRRRPSLLWPLLALAGFGVALVLGFILGVGYARAATPRSASAPSIPVAAQARSGASPDPGVAQRQSTAPPMAVAEVPGSNPGSGVKGDAPLSGIASWYPARGLIAAAGPGLRHGNWRGSHLVVSANGRAVTVELSDWCRCDGGRLIDLSDDAFARLAPLSRGLVRVTIAGADPAPTLSATDR